MHHLHASMSSLILLVFLLFLAFTPAILAQAEEETPESTEPPTLKDISVNSMTFCQDVQDREPVKPADEFSHEIERVYCHTDMNSSLEEKIIKHLWYLEGELVSSIELKVGKSKRWRIWSYKSMYPEAVGKWEVVVQTDDGAVLQHGEFTVK
ncbi:DUF2914 domain-containing protein [bacterium]|nr:DUF2914 domain-containing protein [bacterium]